jgi:hypothetical protein
MIINIINGNNSKYFNAINDFNMFKEFSETGICFNYKTMIVNVSPMESKIL